MKKTWSLGQPLGLTLSLALASCAAHPGVTAKTPNELALLELSPAATSAPAFERDGRPFCFAGANNYYLGYASRAAVLDVLDRAVALHLSVLRTWAFLDMGSLDGAMPSVHEQGKKDGVYFQYWDPAEQRPAYNDGPDGLEHLDFVLSEARKRGLTLILVLTNNWHDFGGMDQYSQWYGLSDHAAFYSDPRTRAAYRAWAEHLIGRTNHLDGTPYRDDPAIFAWELANEPRGSNLPLPLELGHVEPKALTAWAKEMSGHLQSLDPHHLVSVGDEGFFRDDAAPDYQKTGFGVDHEALSASADVDFATVHLYPDHWGWSLADSYDYLRRQLVLAERQHKPVVLEEYGLDLRQGLERRRAGYANWNELLLQGGGSAALFWHLAGMVNGAPYPDYDHFTVYAGDSTAQQLDAFAVRWPVSARACREAPGTAGGSAVVRVAGRE